MYLDEDSLVQDELRMEDFALDAFRAFAYVSEEASLESQRRNWTRYSFRAVKLFQLSFKMYDCYAPVI